MHIPPRQEKKKVFLSPPPPPFAPIFTHFFFKYIKVPPNAFLFECDEKMDDSSWTPSQLCTLGWRVWEVGRNLRTKRLNKMPTAQHRVSTCILCNTCSILFTARHSHQDVTLAVQPYQELGQGEGQQPLPPDSYLCLGSQTVSATEVRITCEVAVVCGFFFFLPLWLVCLSLSVMYSYYSSFDKQPR